MGNHLPAAALAGKATEGKAEAASAETLRIDTGREEAQIDAVYDIIQST